MPDSKSSTIQRQKQHVHQHSSNDPHNIVSVLISVCVTISSSFVLYFSIIWLVRGGVGDRFYRDWWNSGYDDDGRIIKVFSASSLSSSAGGREMFEIHALGAMIRQDPSIYDQLELGNGGAGGGGMQGKDADGNDEHDTNNQAPKTEYRVYSSSERRRFLERHGSSCYRHPSSPSLTFSNTNVVLERYDSMKRGSLKIELWKHCFLYVGGKERDDSMMMVYVDPMEVTLLKTLFDAFSDDSVVFGKNYAVKMANIDDDSAEELDEDSSFVHSSFVMYSNRKSRQKISQNMIRLYVETSDEVLGSSPLLPGRELGRLISLDDEEEGKGSWKLLESRCVELADPTSSENGVWDNISVDGEEKNEIEAVMTAKKKKNKEHLHPQKDSFSSYVHTSETPLSANSKRASRHCTRGDGGRCCMAYQEGRNDDPILALRHPVTPISASYEVMASSRVEDSGSDKDGSVKREGDRFAPLPYRHHKQQQEEAVSTNTFPEGDPYASIIRQEYLPSSSPQEPPHHQTPTPSMFDLLLENQCLPTSKECHKCLKQVKDSIGGDCTRCRTECSCYCSVLCKIRPPPKRITQQWTVHPPLRKLDSERLIPRIVHQTWFEPVDKIKYPNMSRLIESWKRSGWEYNFYDDQAAAEFLSLHFPPEVLQAYESILPGAFKADLFRYCVLLIRGGVYADMDVLLESNLDHVIAPDVGFVTPIDEPGIKVNRRSCLWNGFIGVAPGHPFLARTIQIVVNNIRNRFTSVDYDDMLCPEPVLHVSHTVDTLFTCGPCILGAGMNDVLGRHMQDQFEIGDVDIWHSDREDEVLSDEKNSSKQHEVLVSPDDPRLLIPGRTIILQQNKNDMGAHRFTWTERNVMVAATDMPDYDDRPASKEHYSKTHGKAGVYGVKKLYRDNVSADEQIQVHVKRV